MGLQKEISDFLMGNGITHDTVTISGHSVVVAHIGKDRKVSIIPAAIHAETPEDAAKYTENLSSCIDSIVNDTGDRPLIISEDRWKSQAETTKERILAHLEIFIQIYARNCEVRKIDKNTAAEFLKSNHSYGDASCRYRYGLYLKRHTGHNAGSVSVGPGCLVAVATFSNGRKWIKGEKTIRSYEWTRYASLPGVRLSGGMGRLLKAFIDDVQPDDIMTYADLEWSEGKVYEALGFVLEGFKEPVVFHVDQTWRRFPVKQASTECPSLPEGASLPKTSGNLYYKNLGSNKYRLKLTDYQ